MRSSLGLEKRYRKEHLAKNNYDLEKFLEGVTICLTGCKYRPAFEYSRVLNMPHEYGI